MRGTVTPAWRCIARDSVMDSTMKIDHQKLASAPRTDHGNALRFAAHADGQLCWTPAHSWLHWDGTRWVATESEDAALQLARRVAVGIVKEAAVLPTDPPPGARKSAAEMHLEWSEKSQAARSIAAMVKLGRGSREVLRSSAGWDSQVGKINTPAGLLSLATGTVELHDPSMRVLKVTNGAIMPREQYASSLLGSTWYRFLHWAMCGNHDLIDYLQAAVGASLVGDGRCQHVFFCYGNGGNGKGAFERALRYAIGPYMHALPRRFLEQTRGAPPASDEYNLAHLQGARMAVGAEVSKGALWDEEKIKSLSGGDEVTGRHPYGRPFTFPPSWVLWVLGNDKPRVEGTDSGIWRRLRLIPWLASVADTPDVDKMPHNFEDLLRDEAPLILRWAQEGAAQWCEYHTLPACAVVDAETARYREAEDTIGQALDEMCEFAASGTAAGQMRTQTSVMTQAVIAWHKTRGLSTRAMDRQLGEYLRKRLADVCDDGQVEVRNKGTRYWCGVRLVDEMAAHNYHGGSAWPH
jgi:P4 family phage/plasmid primase-like protien